MPFSFMQIPSLPPEAVDEATKGYIAIKSISQGTTMEVGKFEPRKPRSINRAEHNDFEVKKSLDKASLFLQMLCNEGALLPQINFAFSREDDKEIYLKLELRNVYIAEISLEISDGEEPEESLKLNYQSIDYRYRPKLKGGKMGDWIQLGWDRQECKRLGT